MTPSWEELSLLPEDEGMRSDSIAEHITSSMQASTMKSRYRSHFSLCALGMFYYLNATRLCVDVYRLKSDLGSKRV